MRRFWGTLIVSTMSIVITSPVRSEALEDYQCGKGEDIRRIEIRFEDSSGQLPCRVIYRPETENDTVGTVSWRNMAALEQCQAQAKQVVDRLTSEGWTCAIDDERAHISSEALVAKAVEAKADVNAENTNPSAGNQPAVEVETPAGLLDNPDIVAPPPMLTALINEDLAKLDATLDGNVQAKIVAFDDLNADDIEDALVLLTYASPQPAYRQFLAAYLFDGEAYQLMATKPIAGSSSDTMNATIDDIDQGIIQVTLQSYEPGDDFCCPSGVRQMFLALRNLDLIEIDRSAPTR